MNADDKPKSQQLQQRINNFCESDRGIEEPNVFTEEEAQADVPVMSNLVIAMALKMQSEQESPEVVKKMKLNEYSTPMDEDSEFKFQEPSYSKRGSRMQQRQSPLQVFDLHQRSEQL